GTDASGRLIEEGRRGRTVDGGGGSGYERNHGTRVQTGESMEQSGVGRSDPVAMTGTEGTAGDLFSGEGEVRALARRIDWSGTRLGAVTAWPEALRGVIRTCLASPFPICLWCGP